MHTSYWTVHHASDFMMSRLRQPLVLRDVSEASGLSQRSLIYHFNEVVGITPMAFFKIQRLNAVRRALRSADARYTGVASIATEYQFHHMGHFAADFHKLFGVLPSKVLTAHVTGNERLV